MEDRYKFLVYRVYTQEERPNIRDRSVFYGWTYSKIIRDAFFKQRTKSKYRWRRMYADEIGKFYGEDVTDAGSEINMIKLKSAKSGEFVVIFMTANELKTTEIEIQEMFRQASKLEPMGNRIAEGVEMVTHLTPYYSDALDFIGFRPPEVDSMYPGLEDAAYNDGLTRIEQLVETAYHENIEGYPNLRSELILSSMMTETLRDVFTKIVYSLESFVKVMKNDL